MKRTITINDLKNSPCAKLNPHLFQVKPKKEVKKSKAKTWIEEKLWTWCTVNDYKLATEVQFHPARKWRMDYFIHELNCGIEYEGIFSAKSRHTTQSGYSGDCEKYSEAAKMGIKVLRYTAKNYQNVITDLEFIMSQK